MKTFKKIFKDLFGSGLAGVRIKNSKEGKRMFFFIRKMCAFIHRDFLEALSYKTSFFLQFFSLFISLFIFHFLSKLFGQAVIPSLEPYGGNYFSFVLIGVAFSSYLETSLHSFSQKIREAQMTGTIEAILVTQTEIPTIIISSSLYSFLWTSFQVVIYLIAGIFLFKVDMKGANVMAAGIILLLTITTFSSLGILSASFIMVFKKGDPIAQFFSGLSWFLGGVYYPISVLPLWLRRCSYFIPLTYSLEGMRFALLKGYSLQALKPYILGLGLYTLLVGPLSIFLFRLAVNRAKRDGSLAHY